MSDSAISGATKAPSKPRRSTNPLGSGGHLRDTLSGFGDDVVKVRDSNSQLQNDPFQQGININGEQLPCKFERVPPSEIGVRSSRWRKAIIAGLATSSKTPNKIQATEMSIESVSNEEIGPPFWGVGLQTRNNISGLSLHLILHEIGCFASAVLLGCLLIGVFHKVNLTDPEHWWFTRVYESITTFLLVFTCIGFLIRVDTTEPKSLIYSPLLLILTVLTAVSLYLVKAWTLQASECIKYGKMSEEVRNQIHLTQNCEQIPNGAYDDIATVILKTLPLITTFLISLYLFFYRSDLYIVRKFGRRK